MLHFCFQTIDSSSDEIMSDKKEERNMKFVHWKILVAAFKDIALALDDATDGEKTNICLSVLIDAHHPVFGW